ncbi:MAG: glycosyltransferase family 2 protein [Bacteroidales bacterium]|nr:glycosyltransferase family 2 protein [Bacteroidales bacterium]
MDVSIIIVNYNTCNLLRNCLNSIFKHTEDIDFEVIVSDNGSKDDSLEMIKHEFPQVVLVENNANLGFGTANNRGLKIAKGKYIFYLNSDTLLLNNAVKMFYDYWETSPEKDEIGALGGNLLDENGNIIHSYGYFPRPLKEIFLFCRKIVLVYIKCVCRLFGCSLRLKKKNKTIQKTGEVEYVTGADLFLLNNELAYFDERFFLYYEETNLQWRLMKKGLKRLVIATPKIIHLCGKSDSKTGDGCIDDYISFGAVQTDLSRIRFIKYNISRFYAKILKWLLYWFWMTPGFVKKTKKYRTQIFNI